MWLDEVSCDGFETRLEHCGHTAWGSSDCGHSEDVGVKCGSKFFLRNLPKATLKNKWDSGNIRKNFMVGRSGIFFLLNIFFLAASFCDNTMLSRDRTIAQTIFI